MKYFIAAFDFCLTEISLLLGITPARLGQVHKGEPLNLLTDYMTFLFPT